MQHTTADTTATCAVQRSAKTAQPWGVFEHVRPMLADECGVVVCTVWGTVRELRGRAGVQLRHALILEVLLLIR
jgi:hypothetical protein